MKSIFTISLIFLLTAGVYAKDLSDLYDQSTLQDWQERYAKNIRYNFDNVVLKALKPSEYKDLADVRLEFPLRGEIEGGPLEFYSYPHTNPPVVTIPVLSIKFFDDLAIAAAWLEQNGYKFETVTDYVAMLKYLQPTSFPGGRYLRPLNALQIPANALNDRTVDELSQKILKSALIWVLIHELAHVYYKHPGYGQNVSADQTQQNEIEADRFATEIMRRIGVPPIGIAHFFTIAVHWFPNRSDFQSDTAWRYYVKKATHPLSTRRLSILATDLKSEPEYFVRKEPNYDRALKALHRATADIKKLADFLANESLQKTIKRKAILLSKYPDPLKPRALNE